MRISNEKYKNPLKAKTSGRITVMRICGGNVLKLGFVFCKQNIISHFSGLRWKKGKAEEEEEEEQKMKRRIHFLTRMSTNVQLRSI